LDSGEQFVLLSLDPKRPSPRHDDDPPSKETFHGYAVLGEAVIHDQAIRKELLGALYKGVANSDGDQYACFYPRHGISATLAGEKVDLVICFECLSIDTYGKDKKIVLTTGSPGQTFDKALERAGLPAAQHK
jgi:hypothetical protein